MANKNNSEYINALEYHQKGRPGKLSIKPTKALCTQHDLSLAYSPGVAAPCLEIVKDSNNIYKYTSKANTVAVISNGTAVLGLGAIGAAASKPVMEGKSVLFKKFADIDSFDLEVDTTDSDEFINVVKYLGHSWGGINLEDIKAPECFIIEKKLKEIMDIPVFHDDQHGTAIITAAGIINAVYLTKRKMDEVKVVVNGAGAAAIACIDLIIKLGIKSYNITLCDSKGVIYKGRAEGMNPWKESKAIETKARSLADAMKGSDIFLGLSVKNVVSKDMVKSMSKSPIIFAMANPDPEITPEDIMSVRDDAIIATGRSDYNNQINNVMGFPYIFRGALDIRAKSINDEMKMAAAKALAHLARESVPIEVRKAYGGTNKFFGPNYIIPAPFDPRLLSTVSAAVAQAAIDSGVAKIKEIDLKAYKKELSRKLNPTMSYTHLLHETIQHSPLQKIVLAEGEEEEALKAAILMRDENYARPIIVGRLERINAVLDLIGGKDQLDGITVMNAALTDKLDKYIEFLYSKLGRSGYLYRDCGRMVKTDKNIFSACMVACGDADGLITGLTKNFYDSLKDIQKVIPTKENQRLMGYSIMMSGMRNIIIADNTIADDPQASDIVKIAQQSAQIAITMGLKPRVAIVSQSNFGNPSTLKSKVIQDAVLQLNQAKVNFEYDGDISINVALNEELQKLYPCCKLTGPANILIMPNLDAAAISTSLLEEFSEGSFIGPILNGFKHPVQILSMNSSANDILQLAAFAAIESIAK
ncbi:MAG TPA: NADP-dependent malic enzyme [Candidatus Megaira endosymbiont of Nemacystus decipiens]|nr:NADP-dependent malic enzyme [Candidatus Megaera endosymbiont of Nemacystus decipiens]